MLSPLCPFDIDFFACQCYLCLKSVGVTNHAGIFTDTRTGAVALSLLAVRLIRPER